MGRTRLTSTRAFFLPRAGLFPVRPSAIEHERATMSLPPSTHTGATSVATQPDDVDDYSSDSDSERGTYAAAQNGELDDWSEGGEDDLEVDDPSMCLFCTRIIPTQVELKAHLLDTHAFDFRRVVNALELDFYGQMKVINYIRERTSKGGEAHNSHQRLRFD
jgi:hypothetical protein